jgi:integrase
MERKNGVLKDFERFLLKLGNIPEEKTKFYLYWVRRFLKFSNYELENIHTERISQYLDSLGTDEKIKDWQVKQAADAVILYVEKYLNRPLQEVTPQKFDVKKSLQWEQMLEEARNAIRLRHFSLSTEKTYLGWIARFKIFLKDRDPYSLEVSDMKNFLTHLARVGRVSASTQNQAFNALLFLYRHILNKEVDDLTSVPRAKRRMNLPTVLSRDEVKSLLSHLNGVYPLEDKRCRF